jgi:mannosyl-3-phosphoglycerate phosphatase
MDRKKKLIIFTDLDGTLLDFDTYSYKIAKPLIKKIKSKGIPLVFCTAKTKAENEHYRKQLKINDPFIVENGGAIFIPKNYFHFDFSCRKVKKFLSRHGVCRKILQKYYLIELGAPYKKIRRALQKIKKHTGFRIIGFGDMTAKQIAQDAGFSGKKSHLKMAFRAKQKMYNESFIFQEPRKKEKILNQAIKKLGFNLVHGGRYYNIMGKNADKGKAVKILTKFFEKEYKNKEICTIGLGDSLNDLPMLKTVDIPILVQKPSGIWEPKIKIKKMIKIKGIGPFGWTKALQKYV